MSAVSRCARGFSRKLPATFEWLFTFTIRASSELLRCASLSVYILKEYRHLQIRTVLLGRDILRTHIEGNVLDSAWKI